MQIYYGKNVAVMYVNSANNFLLQFFLNKKCAQHRQSAHICKFEKDNTSFEKNIQIYFTSKQIRYLYETCHEVTLSIIACCHILEL